MTPTGRYLTPEEKRLEMNPWALEDCEDATIGWRTPYQICTVWFEPGRMAEFTDALVEILAPPSARTNEGAESEAACF